MHADPCQADRDALRRAIEHRDAYQESMGDLLDQGMPIESIKRELKILDQMVVSATRGLYFCEHPMPLSTTCPQAPPRTPEPQRILDIRYADPDGGPGYQNAEFVPPAGGNWASNLVGGHTLLDLGASNSLWEWTPVLDKNNQYDLKMAAVAGTVILPDISDKDIPFVHPFGFDWECFVAPDVDFQSLLAPGNVPGSDDEYHCARNYAHDVYDLTVPGALGIETDQDLVPFPFRPLDGDRIVAYGRWIVDAGHPDFHTEIHPPLLIASARDAFGLTESTVISRPYLVNQDFGDGPIRQHLINQIGAAVPFPPVCVASSYHLRAEPQLFKRPFEGDKYMSYVVRPKHARPSPNEALMALFDFHVRPGVTVELFDESANNEAVRVLIHMDPVAYVPPLHAPKSNEVNYDLDNLDDLYKGLGSYIKLGLVGIAGTGPAAGVDPVCLGVFDLILSRGVLTLRYAAPTYQDADLTTVSAGQLGTVAHYTVDVSQDFPVVGWLNVAWESELAPALNARCELIRTQLNGLNHQIGELKRQLAAGGDPLLVQEILSLEREAGTVKQELRKRGCA